jgi:hypothetical protein
MSTTPLVFSFGDSTTADGNRFAGSLADTLRDLDPSMQVERLRDRADTQDFGATLVEWPPGLLDRRDLEYNSYIRREIRLGRR